MNAIRELYEQKKRTLEECLQMISSDTVITYAGGGNEPYGILSRLHTRAPELHNLRIVKGPGLDYDFMRLPGMDGHINTECFFYTAACRDGQKYHNVSYIPANLSNFGAFAQELFPCNLYLAGVSPMDENGDFCIGLNCIWGDRFLKKAEKIILEVSNTFPPVCGGTKINIRDVDFLYEYDTPDPQNAFPSATAEEEKIAQYCRSLMRDGDCFQLGIGGMPNALTAEMMDLRDLGVHTEMFTPAIGEMIEQGIVTGAQKQIDRGLHVGAFAAIDHKLHDVLRTNPNCRMLPSAYVNDPCTIMQNDNVVSVNTCIEIDLTGQICSESIGHKQYSGTGGALDFALGALRSKGGRGIITLTSKTKSGQSKIRCDLTPGAVVTVPRTCADYIITEYGIAPLRGRSVRQRVENLIAIAHPDFRKELRKQAEQNLLI